MDLVHGKYLLIKNKSLGEDPLVDKILSENDVDKDVKILYHKARALYLSSIKKNYVEACLIASRDLGKVSEIIEIPIDIIYIYQEIFFNVKDYDKLSLLELIQNCEDPEEKSMKIWALSQGLDFIAWRLGKTINLSPVDGLQELFTLSIYKSKEALFSSNTAESSREATKWTKLSMELAKLLKGWVADSDAALSDIELALSSVMPEFKSFDSLDVDVDIN